MAKFDMFRNHECQAFAAGETIFRQGDAQNYMFCVNEGEAELLAGKKTLKVWHPGENFGKMPIIHGPPPTATAVARTECKLVPIDQQRFQFLVQQTPYFAIEVMRVLADRL